ncbi:MAG: DUF3847 domain-containing protein [Lachnospiraceae bacterium]|nr:DUF3847 domain-containing protein [Lachnospiraceae bacterium]
MGRRKIPQTREEIKAEIDLTENQIRQMENREKLYVNAYSREERKIRTRRLCIEAGILEHFVPELKEMEERDAEDFIRIAVTSTEAQAFLRKRGLRSEENEVVPESRKH